MTHLSSQPSTPLQEFLIQNKPLHSALNVLKTKYNIKSKGHTKHPELLLFTYQSMRTPWQEPVTQQCRGIIIDTSKPTFPIVAYPFDKFFNYNEKWASKVEFDQDVCVYEKLDGSICTVYNYEGEWYMASSGVPDAVFSKLFWSIWEKLEMKAPKDTTKCYIFEMCTNEKRVLVPHPEDRIVLIGSRDMSSFKELNHAELLQLGEDLHWEVIQKTCLNAQSVLDVVEAAQLLDPSKSEGFVICDTKFRRVKVKSPQYVSLSALSMKQPEDVRFKHMYTVLRVNEEEEFLAYFPQHSSSFEGAKKRFRLFCEVMSTLAGYHRSGLRGSVFEIVLQRVFQWKHVVKTNPQQQAVLECIEKLSEDDDLQVSVALQQMNIKHLEVLITRVYDNEDDVRSVFKEARKMKGAWEEHLIGLAKRKDKSAKELRQEKRAEKQKKREEFSDEEFMGELWQD